MIGVLVCGAFALALFSLAALADERWPDRLSRRGQQLLGQQPSDLHRPAYSYVVSRSRGASASRMGGPSPVGH